MPFLNPGHIWLIMLLLVVVLIVWGPGKLPEVGAGMGRAIKEFRSAASSAHDSMSRAVATPPETVHPAEAPGTEAGVDSRR
ncbi:MAG TPA: twin-arginine translocase TatA/TatE family subunit [Candidatus Dormibacteraeota bacterium]|jgi:sec-independent protein translocase protein TatA|nr:twin-arginine translocase TatA/TatE family subunit [Candidatus Dormibacteraeota bacterium]